MEKLLRVEEETWGLGITRTEILRVDEREEEFFKELLQKYERNTGLMPCRGIRPPFLSL